MAKLTLIDIANLSGNPGSAQTNINANNALIEAAIENTLSRDGTAPNTMSADLDMNSNDINNLGTAIASGGGGGTYNGCLVRSATISVPTSTYTYIACSIEDHDLGSFHDNATNNSRITIPAGVAYVRLSCNVDWGTSTGAWSELSILKNRASFTAGLPDLRERSTQNAQPAYSAVSAVVSVVEGDYFEVRVYHAKGSNCDAEVWFSLEVVE